MSSTVNSPRCWAVIPAAGKGARMGAPLPKQYLKLGDRAILAHTLERFLKHPLISGVTIAIAADDELWPTLATSLPQVHQVEGGAERCHSVLNALASLRTTLEDDDWVLVHDAARPCIHADDISRLITTLKDTACGGILGTAVRDTLKRCAADGTIEETVDRARVWHALTPQMFRYGWLHRALSGVLASGTLVTDEAQAIELAGGVARLVEGRADNIKITRPEDLALAECFLRAQAEET